MENWILQHWIELLGTISGIVYVFLEIRQKLWMWYVGIATSALYVIVFYKSGLYADMSLNIYYVIISIYGWYCWKFGKSNTSNHNLVISKASIFQILLLLLITAVLTYIISVILQKYTDSSVPVMDALITAGSIIATWMLAKKLLEQWIFWIVINAISIGLFVYKELYITSILFVVYLILAFVGYLEWRKEYKSYGNN